jgi:nucleoside-diphosphate-sugar epimerase
MKCAAVAGASGFIGRRIAEYLLTRGWKVLGLARNAPAAAVIPWIAVDLADRESCTRALRRLDEVTHVFYAARYDHPVEGSPEPVEINASMLTNVVETLESVAPLEHVHAVHGSKYYGHQLGPVPVPLREEHPRAPGRNFYFDQEDFLRERSRTAKWSYSTARPHSFCDPALDHARSLGLVIAVYAAIQRELGLPFDFPGSDTGYTTLTQFTEVALLARAAVWMATEPRCANQSFNVVNGDHPRWSELWPRFAEYFRLPPGAPGKFSLAEYMRDKAPVWNAIVTKYGLRETQLHDLVLWSYGDYQFRPQWDVASSMDKARALGFTEDVNSAEMFVRHFDHYRASKVIPAE